jgi:hypothetical protein
MGALKDDRLEADPAATFSWAPACGVPVLEWVGDVVLTGAVVAVVAIVVETAGLATVAAVEAENVTDAALVNEWNGFTYVNFGLETGCDVGLVTSFFGSAGLISATVSCLVSDGGAGKGALTARRLTSSFFGLVRGCIGSGRSPPKSAILRSSVCCCAGVNSCLGGPKSASLKSSVACSVAGLNCCGC